MAKFSEQINDAITKTKVKSEFVFRESCRQVSFDIAEKTGVSTGKLLGKWSPSINSIDDHEYSGGKSAWSHGKKNEAVASANRTAAEANLFPRIISTTQALSLRDKYYFTNSTEYAPIAEHEGWEKTEAFRMVYNTVQEWKWIVADVLERYKS